MTLSLRRVGIAIGALTEAALIVWLLQGFLPAGIFALLVTVILGGLIYREIVRRDRGSV